MFRHEEVNELKFFKEMHNNVKYFLVLLMPIWSLCNKLYFIYIYIYIYIFFFSLNLIKLDKTSISECPVI